MEPKKPRAKSIKEVKGDEMELKEAPPFEDKRPLSDQVYLVVCKDGRVHLGCGQNGTLEYAEKLMKGIGHPMTALDDWGHRCKPHRIQRFVAAPEK